jgi:hypothetical protein
MPRRTVPFVKQAALAAAAFVLVASQARAGDRVHAPSRSTTPSPAATVVRALPPSTGVSVVVTLPRQAVPEKLYVNLRGPDGQVRRFPVEGGRAAIQYRSVTLQPGEMLTIRWAPAK